MGQVGHKCVSEAQVGQVAHFGYSATIECGKWGNADELNDSIGKENQAIGAKSLIVFPSALTMQQYTSISSLIFWLPLASLSCSPNCL